MALDTPAEMLPNPQQEKQAQEIGQQLRCLVCQNESIEDSSATLARDLRHVVREHVASGETSPQIMSWMVQRYGNFIRLSPPLNALTFLLWGMPMIALLCAGSLSFYFYRKNKQKRNDNKLSDEEQKHLKEICNKN